MFTDYLDKSFIVTRTSTITDPVTHIAKTQTVNLGPYPCSTGRANGTVIQSSPQTTFTQSVRLYTLINANIKTGDIITVYDVKFANGLDLSTLSGIKYTVGNPYKPRGHHIEADITFKSEV